MSSVLIYRDQLLHSSETFVHEQAKHLPNYQARYAGMKYLPDGHPLSHENMVVVNRRGWLGRMKEAFAQFVRFPPAFLRTVEAWEPDLIHSHFGPDAVNALRLAQHLDVPLAVTYHSHGVTTQDEHARESYYRHRVYLRRREQLKGKVDCFIAVSKFIKAKMMEQGFPEEKIEQHYVGVDTDYFKPSTVEDQRSVLFVGRLTEKKGLQYLIYAMERVQKKYSGARLVVIGDGKRREELESVAARRLAEFEFLGFQPPNVVRDWMNRATMLAVPSVTAETGESEGLPTVVMEAQATGLAVVGSEHAGIPEVVRHGETGFLAPERDWEQLADYIERLLHDTELRKSFGQLGRRRMKRKFDVRKQSKMLEKIYNTLTENQ